MDEPTTFRCWIEAGLLIRHQVINFVTGEAWKLGLDCKHERAGAVIRFTVSGNSDAVARFARWFPEWAQINAA